MYKGRVLKHEEIIKELHIEASEFVVVVPKAGTAAPPPAAPSEAVAQLCAMGFERAKVEEALKVAENNVEHAVDYLFNGWGLERSRFRSVL